MALPRKLKNLNLFNDGQTYIGQVGEVTLPKLTRKMEDWRGGGMNAPIKIDQGMEGLEFEVVCGGLMRDVFAQFGIARHDGVMLRFAGAYQRDDTGQVDAVEVVVRGRHEEIEAGKAKAGDDTEFKFKTVASYYKLSVNGQTLVEIDIPNFVEVIDGVDRMMQQRMAIGA
ncbi:phage major tail tube protein [Thermomonas sp.]|uniref:phage major tail tube protein n=1 Tax=Thermomonas sp. TaxID=1971895 RepID=UPI0035B4976C